MKRAILKIIFPGILGITMVSSLLFGFPAFAAVTPPGQDPLPGLGVNLVQNGSFETNGMQPDWTAAKVPVDSVPYWTSNNADGVPRLAGTAPNPPDPALGTACIEIWKNGFLPGSNHPVTAADGSYLTEVNCFGLDTYSQDIPIDYYSNSLYKLSMMHAGRTGQDTLQVVLGDGRYINGSTKDGQYINQNLNGGGDAAYKYASNFGTASDPTYWRYCEWDFVPTADAAGAVDTLSLTASGVSNNTQLGSGNILDDVQIMRIADPTVQRIPWGTVPDNATLAYLADGYTAAPAGDISALHAGTNNVKVNILRSAPPAGSLSQGSDIAGTIISQIIVGATVRVQYVTADGKVLFSEDAITDSVDPTYDVSSLAPQQGAEITVDGITYAYQGETTGDPVAGNLDSDKTVGFLFVEKPTPITYTVTFDGNKPAGSTGSVTGSMGDQVAVYGQNLTLNANGYALAGYTFTNWNTAADGSGASYADNAAFPYTIADNMTLYAQWMANMDTPYTVEHYYVDSSGTAASAPFAVESFTGTTDTAAAATPKTSGTGYTYDATFPGTVASGTIAGDGSLILKLYYLVNKYSISYAYTGTIPAGAPLAPPAETAVPFGTNKAVAPAPALAGYTFSGWGTADVIVNSGSFAMPDNNVSFTGSWIPNPATTYAVEHYYVDETGTAAAAPFENISFTGMTNTTATALPKTGLAGYTYDPSFPGTVASGTIAGNGSLVLKLYYRVNQYTVSYGYTGTIPPGAPPAPPADTGAPFGANITVGPAPALDGYTFSGWTTTDATVDNGNFTMPDNDVAFTGSWTANKYTLSYDGNGGTGSMATQTATFGQALQTVGNVFTYLGKTFLYWIGSDGTNYADGYAFNPWDIAGNLKLIAHWGDNHYTVNYDTNGGTPSPMAAKTNVLWDDASLLPAEPVRAGYGFSGWNVTAGGSGTNVQASAKYSDLADSDADGGSITLTAQWTANIATAYKVEYYQQNLNANTYTLAGADDLSGVTDLAAEVAPRTYVGFTLQESKTTYESSVNAASPTVLPIAPDGSLTVKLYYDRNLYTIVYSPGAHGDFLPDTHSDIQFGDGTPPFAGNTGSGGYPLAETGYHFTRWDPALSATVSGYAVYTAKWAPNIYTVSYKGNKPAGAEGRLTGRMTDQTAVYGQDLTLDANNYALTGYTFTGWNTASNGRGTPYANNSSFPYMTASNMTLYAQWASNKGTAYRVEYYLQDLNANTYTLAGAENLTGATASAAKVAVRNYDGFTYQESKTTYGSKGNAASATVLPITADGSLTVRLYYDRNIYLVVYSPGAHGAFSADAHSDIPYGAATPAFAGSRDGNGYPLAETGYHFTGWDPVPAATVSNYIVYTAQWSPNPYVLSFDANGGTGGMDSMKVYYNDAVTLPGVGFEREGFAFAGWNTKPDGSGVSYADSAAFSYTAPGDMTLYAQWIPPIVTVSAQTNGSITIKNGSGNIVSATGTTISGSGVPLSNAAQNGGSGGWSLLSMLMALTALIASAVSIVGIFFNRMLMNMMLKEAEQFGASDSEKDGIRMRWRRSSLVKALTAVFGVVTLVAWLAHDWPLKGMVWTNNVTPFVMALFIVWIVITALYNVRKNKLGLHYEKA